MPLEFSPFSCFPGDHRTCFAGSLVGRGASFLRGSLLLAPCLSFSPCAFSFLLSLSLYRFYLLLFFKRRLITAAASTIDSMKRIITNDYHFPSCCVIGGERAPSVNFEDGEFLFSFSRRDTLNRSILYSVFRHLGVSYNL